MRRPHDAYYSPPWLVTGLLSAVPEIDGTILECCAGDGSMARALEGPGRMVIQNDHDPMQEGMDLHFDARSHLLYEHAPSVDFVISNPPYATDQMLPIIKLALMHARKGVAMLGRISFLEPTVTRGPWLRAHPPDRYLVTERHSFTGDGKSDSCTTAWLVWACRGTKLSGRPIEILHGFKPRRGVL